MSTIHSARTDIRRRWRTAVLGIVLLSALGQRVTSAQVIPSAPQFTVKDYPGFFFDRGSDATVVDLEGNFVVVWSAPNQQDVFGQRFNANGVAVGAEFQISTSPYPYDLNTDPSVASDLDGNFVVVWEHSRDDNVYPGSPEEIVGRRYDDQAALDTSEFVINSPSPFRHEKPAVARAGNSNFVVVWQREYPEGNSGGVNARAPGVFGQRFNPEGARIGEQFLVTTDHGEDGADNALPDVSSDLGGNFVVVWEYQGSLLQEENQWGIAARRFDSFANSLDETEFSVNSYTTGPQRNPSVAVGLDGTFVIVWAGDGSGDPSNYGIFAKRFHPTGGALADDFLVNTSTAGFQSEPDVAVADADGHFLVTWSSRPLSPPEFDVKARWFRNDTVAFEPEFEVSTFSVGDQEVPIVAGDVNGNFVVVWNGDGPTNEGFFARRLEQPVLLSINDLAIEEGDGESPGSGVALLTVEASRAHPTLDVTAEYATEDDLANSFNDYVASSGEVFFGAGTDELTAVIDVPILGDDVFEPDETFLIHLSNAANAAVVRDQGVGVILNDDDPPGLTIADAAIEEGNAGTSILAFRVDLAEVEQEDATVDFSTSDGSATGSNDYQATSGTLTIPGGSMSGFVGIEVNGDFVSELDESFTVTLSNPTNAVLIDETAIGTILDDDCAVAVTIDPSSANFPVGGGPGSIAVSDPQACGWAAESNAAWLQITSAASGAGNGSVDYLVAANSDPLPRNGAISILGESHTVIQDGVSCSLGLSPSMAEFNPGGGVGSLDISDPGSCGWTAVSNAPWLTVTNGGTGVGDGSVEYSVDPNTDPGDRAGTILVSGLLFTVGQQGPFFDHFDDGALSSSWVYSGPQFLSESNSFLEADVLGTAEAFQAIATPAFGGCIECTIESRLGTEAFALGEVTLFGWYVDADNHVGLTMNEFTNQWKLFQRVGGVEVESVTTDSEPILPSTLYNIELVFDGSEIFVSVDGDRVLSSAPWMDIPPQGTVGFHATATVAVFDFIGVLTVTEAPGEGLIFANGFEEGGLGGWSLQSP